MKLVNRSVWRYPWTYVLIVLEIFLLLGGGLAFTLFIDLFVLIAISGTKYTKKSSGSDKTVAVIVLALVLLLMIYIAFAYLVQQSLKSSF